MKIQCVFSRRWIPFYLHINVSKYGSLPQIVETDTVSLEFSGKILTFTPRTFVLAENSEMCSSPPPVLSHAYFGALSLDDCNTQINIGGGETNTNVSRFEASIVAPQGN